VLVVHHQLRERLGTLERHGPDQQLVDEREHRRREPYGEGQHEHCQDARARAMPQTPDRVAHVDTQFVDPPKRPGVAAGHLYLVRPAQRLACGRPCLVR